jgi:hypothetical protein
VNQDGSALGSSTGREGTLGRKAFADKHKMPVVWNDALNGRSADAFCPVSVRRPAQ